MGNELLKKLKIQKDAQKKDAPKKDFPKQKVYPAPPPPTAQSFQQQQQQPVQFYAPEPVNQKYVPFEYIGMNMHGEGTL